ncbi:MAG: trypsin-like serine peptidase [Planctomycetota bacterium]|jgi:hypothetical protein
MKTHHGTFVALVLMAYSGIAAAQTSEEVLEAFPEVLPMSANEGTPPPKPYSVDMTDAFVAGRNIHKLDELEEADIAVADHRVAMKYSDVKPGPLRAGINRSPNGGPIRIRDGAALAWEWDDGEQLHTLAVQSPGALGLRLHVTEFNVGDGQMIVYASDGQKAIVRGPYTGRGPNRTGDFWTASVPGDTAYIEIRSVDSPSLAIAELVHFDLDIFSGSDTAFSPPLLPCHEDVNCHSVSAAAQAATGQMNFSDGVDDFICTGTLLTDLDGETVMPWFITARHCLNSQAEVDTLEVVWFWETPACDDEANLPSWWSLPRTVGGTHIRQYGENDMEFMLLTDDLPGGIGFAGWTQATSAGSYGIHHPKGDWKRWVDLSDVTIGCGSKDPTDYDSYDQDEGLTQKGSSGSGVFNNNGQLGGQLWGICSATTDPDDLNCSNIGNFWAVYGEFETSFDDAGISYWLGLGGTMYVDGDYDGWIQVGAEDYPFNNIADALDNSWPGLRIKIDTNTYPEYLTIDEPVTLMAINGTVTIGQ